MKKEHLINLPRSPSRCSVKFLEICNHLFHSRWPSNLSGMSYLKLWHLLSNYLNYIKLSQLYQIISIISNYLKLWHLSSGEVQAVFPVFSRHCSKCHWKTTTCPLSVGIPNKTSQELRNLTFDDGDLLADPNPRGLL